MQVDLIIFTVSGWVWRLCGISLCAFSLPCLLWFPRVAGCLLFWVSVFFVLALETRVEREGERWRRNTDEAHQAQDDTTFHLLLSKWRVIRKKRNAIECLWLCNRQPREKERAIKKERIALREDGACDGTATKEMKGMETEWCLGNGRVQKEKVVDALSWRCI